MSDQESNAHPLEYMPMHYRRVYKYWRSAGMGEKRSVEMALLAYSNNVEYQRRKSEFTTATGGDRYART